VAVPRELLKGLVAEEAAREVGRVRSREAPGAAVVVMGLGADLALARAALRAGAQGYVHAGMQPRQIARALSVAASGEVAVPRELLKGLVAEEAPADLGALSARQREVLSLVAEGMTNAQIAGRLYLSESTVKQHLRGAYKVLGVKNRTGAARLLRDSA
jgi:DNA-binding NarL/FixJ family response regulator